jgi:hypothetical protein
VGGEAFMRQAYRHMTQETESLARVVDEVNDAFFHGNTLSDSQRKQLAIEIASTVGKPGSYAGMFAPSDTDVELGVKTFTGESLRSRAGISHVLGEEACRSLILLNVPDFGTKAALAQATHGMLQRLNQSEAEGYTLGIYCCGTCSVAYWRHLAIGGLDRNEERLTAAVKALRTHRTGNGRWKRFPFYYAVLALSEMNRDLALDEMRYVAPVLERLTKNPSPKKQYSERRRTLFERILARC